MSAVDQLSELEPLEIVGAECVAFVADNQTHSVIDAIAKDYYGNVEIRDGEPSDVLNFLSGAPAPKVLIVDLAGDDQPLDTMLSLTTAFTDDTRLIGIGEVNDVSLYRELTSAGVTDYLVKPISESALAMAFQRAQEPAEKPLGPDMSVKDTKRVVILGARGGVGSSTLAVNLGWIFSEQNKMQTALVDLDLEFGTIALSLDLEPTRGLREALENPSRIDSLFIGSATAKLTDKLSIMATEEVLSGDVVYDSEAIDTLFSAIGKTNDCIVVDLPRPAFGMRQSALRAATHIILVTELSLPGLRDTIRLLGNVEEAAKGTPIIVVANHGGGTQQAMRMPDFQKALGRKVDILIPDEPKSFNEAANTGKPLVHSAPRSKAAKSFLDIAEKIIGKSKKSGKKSESKKPWAGLFKGSK